MWLGGREGGEGKGVGGWVRRREEGSKWTGEEGGGRDVPNEVEGDSGWVGGWYFYCTFFRACRGAKTALLPGAIAAPLRVGPASFCPLGLSEAA